MPFDGLLIDAEVTRIRHRAADLIEHRGHCKGSFHVGRRTCLLNAIHEAETGEDFDGFKAPTPLMHATLAALGFAGIAEVCDFNNKATTTGKSLVARLRGA